MLTEKKIPIFFPKTRNKIRSKRIIIIIIVVVFIIIIIILFYLFIYYYYYYSSKKIPPKMGEDLSKSVNKKCCKILINSYRKN
jgi:heme/copper-type cytochrome/quinol oxidase subunit 2